MALKYGKIFKNIIKDIGFKMRTTRYITNWFIPRTLVIIIVQHFRTGYRLSQVQSSLNAISVIDAMSVFATIIIIVVVVVDVEFVVVVVVVANGVVLRNIDFNLDGMISNEKDLYLNALKKIW